ncbi:hypothetical protein SDC9_98532 [bioreactor metagenome]|uniref:Uncharacterized protein n=1 Tax=bioreactor metagenome TaxID=1076179 RepID=A0A645AHL8_9ZZZZ
MVRGFLAVAVDRAFDHRQAHDVEHGISLGRSGLRAVGAGQLEGEAGFGQCGHPEQCRIIAHHQQCSDFEFGQVAGGDRGGRIADRGHGHAAAGDLVLEPLVFLLGGAFDGFEIRDKARFILDDGRKNVGKIAFFVGEIVTVKSHDSNPFDD